MERPVEMLLSPSKVLLPYYDPFKICPSPFQAAMDGGPSDGMGQNALNPSLSGLFNFIPRSICYRGENHHLAPWNKMALFPTPIAGASSWSCGIPLACSGYRHPSPSTQCIPPGTLMVLIREGRLYNIRCGQFSCGTYMYRSSCLWDVPYFLSFKPNFE